MQAPPRPPFNPSQQPKRKPPAWTQSASPGPSSSSFPGNNNSNTPGSRSSSVPVKNEPLENGGGDVKRRKVELSGSVGNYRDPRTAALDLRTRLKKATTMNFTEAFLTVEGTNPGMDANVVLDLLKGLDRVKYNENNRVFEYIPELTLTTPSQLSAHIRLHSTPTKPLSWKLLREAIPTNLNPPQMLESLEKEGSIIIMRNLGPFRDTNLPPLGGVNVDGIGICDNEPGRPAGARFKSVFWDEVRERGRAGERVDDETIKLWRDVQIAETDDVAKLLAEQELSASSVIPPPPKINASGPAKKKKAGRRTLKITNTHMKAQGIDFSQDYERPS